MENQELRVEGVPFGKYLDELIPKNLGMLTSRIYVEGEGPTENPRGIRVRTSNFCISFLSKDGETCLDIAQKVRKAFEKRPFINVIYDVQTYPI